jgi:hypothetical protein
MCGCDKNKKDKYRTGGNGGELGETGSTITPLCKKVKFTLIVTLNFDNKTSKKLKSHFNSKPNIRGCTLPNNKDFIKAYRNLLKKYNESLFKGTSSKDNSPQIVNKNVQVSTTVGSDKCGTCECNDGECGVSNNARSAANCCHFKTFASCGCRYKAA